MNNPNYLNSVHGSIVSGILTGRLLYRYLYSYHFFRIKQNVNLHVMEGPCPCKFEVGIEGKINGEAEKTILDEKQKKLRQKFRPYTHNSEILLSPRLN